MKRTKTENTKDYQNQIQILGGKGMVYTTPESNGNFYFRTWVSSSKKYYRKSLRTKDRTDAIRIGEEMMVEILGKVKIGHHLFGATFNEVCEEFLAYQLKRNKSKHITAQRVDTLNTQVRKWIVPFVGLKTLCSNLNRNSFLEYGMYRRKETNYAVKDVTIKNEYTTVNAICRFAYQRDFLPFEKFIPEEIKIREPARRDTFTLEEYKHFYTEMRNWVKETNDPKEIYYRTLMRDFVFVKTNSFMRFGEIMNLKWKMCKTYKFKGETMMELNLPSNICKNGKSRKILAKGGQYLERIKKWSKYTEPDDYVFNDYYKRDRISRFHMYRKWRSLLQYTKSDELMNEKGEKKDLTFYALRHLGITFRLMSNVNIYEVSELAGTEVRFIQHHYSHLDITKMRNTALKTFKTTRDGAVVPLMGDEKDIDIEGIETKLR